MKQEILMGKSFCDICINEPNMIKESIDSECQIFKPYGSILHDLCKDDQMREAILYETESIADSLMIGVDLNFTGTIYRAIKLKSYKAIGYLLEHILKHLNSFEYYGFFMYDLQQIIKSSNKIQILEFVGRSEEERKNKYGNEQFCKVEIMLKCTHLPTFSHVNFNAIKIEEIKDYIHQEDEIKHRIKDEQKMIQSKQGDSKMPTFELEHSYIDF